jgi:hypothetical protein
MDEAVDNEHLVELLREASSALASGQRSEALHALLDVRDSGVVHRGLDEAIEWLRDDPDASRREALEAWVQSATQSVQSGDATGPSTPSAWLDGGASSGLGQRSSAAVEFEEVSDDEVDREEESQFEPVDFDVDAFESGGFDSGFFEQDDFSQGPFSSRPPSEDDRREHDSSGGEAESAGGTDDDLSFELVDGDDSFGFGGESSEASDEGAVEFDPFDDMSPDPSEDEVPDEDDWRQKDSVDVDSDAETAVPDFKEAQQYGADMMAGFSDKAEGADETAEGRSAGSSSDAPIDETADGGETVDGSPDEPREAEDDEEMEAEQPSVEELFGDSLFEDSEEEDAGEEHPSELPAGFSESSQPTKVADSDSIELALRDDGGMEGPDGTFQGMGARSQDEDDDQETDEHEVDEQQEELGDAEDSENRYREPTPFKGHDAIGKENSEPTREHEVPPDATMQGAPTSATDKEPLGEDAEHEFSEREDTPGGQTEGSEFEDDERTQAVDPLNDDEFFELVESIADGEEGDTDRTRQGRPAYRGEPIVDEDEQNTGDESEEAVGFEDSEVTAGSEEAPTDFATRGPGADFVADTGASDLSTGAVKLINEAEELYEDGRYESAKDIVSSVLENHPDSDRASELLEMIEDAKGHTDPTEQLGGLNQVPRREVSMAKVSSLDLDHRAGFVLSLVDGEVTFADILDLSSMSREETLDVLIDMYEADVISVD